MAGRRFWRIRSAADGESAELFLYGVISEETWWGDEVTPKQFLADLAALGDVKEITVRINSPGGDVFAGVAIYNSLRNHPATIRVYVDGWAASAASLVAMAGETIVMPRTAMMVIHNPAAMVCGDYRDLAGYAEALLKIRDVCALAYVERTGLDVARVNSLMDAETWMNGSEAVELGFADEVDEQKRVTASLKAGLLVVNGLGFGLDRFKMIPAAMVAGGEEVIGLAVRANGEGPVEPGVSGQGDPETTAEPVEPGVSGQGDPETTAEPVEPGVSGQGDPETTATTAEGGELESAVAPVASGEVLAERGRIAAIQAMARAGAEGIISRAIASGAEPGAVAMEILGSEQVQNLGTLAARAADAPRVAGGAAPVAGDAKAAESKSRVGKLVAALNARLGIRG
jgi:ATP-dependent protease ClpP protease subunit